MRKADLIGGIGLFLAGLFLIFFVIPVETEEGTFYGLSPKVYPTVMAAGMTLCALGLIAQSLLQRAHADDPFPMTAWQFVMFLLSAVIVLVSVMIIGEYGIWFGGPVLISCLMLFLGERNIPLICVTAILPVGILYVLATYALKAPLP